MGSHTDRVIVLVDMDCFYCQVEERLEPSLVGKPIAVVQYNAWKGGGIIAVNYPARDKGVTRHMRGDEAKEKCPDIILVRVPNVRGKADLTKYREGGKRVAEVLQTFTRLLERASIDEAYLDITTEVNNRIANTNYEITKEDLKSTFVVGNETEHFIHNTYHNDLHSEDNLKLVVGGAIVEEIRAAVYENTGYRCSAGIAHNKILAKLVCGMNKPNKQTILPHDGIEKLYKNLSIRKIKSLGGKFGQSLSEQFQITNMSELAKLSEQDLLKKYDEKTASWLYNIARGIDTEPVTIRLVSKSIGCCKKFPGKNCLRTVEDVTHWLSELASEISERLEQDLEENNRRAKQVVVSFAQEINKKDVSNSRTQNLNSYDAKKILNDTFETLKKFAQKSDGSFAIKFLGLSAGKFDNCKNISDISSFFKQLNSKETTNESTQEIEVTKNNNFIINKCGSKTYGEKKKRKNGIENFFEVNTYKKICIKETNEAKKNTKLSERKIDAVQIVNSNEYIKQELEENKNHSEISTSKETKDHELNLSDIEEDTDDSLDFTRYINEDLENKSVNEDSYSNSTIELDYSETLKTKVEFGSKEITSNYKDIAMDENSVDSNISGSSSPVFDRLQLGDTSKSFFMRYMKKPENNSPTKNNPNKSNINLVHEVESTLKENNTGNSICNIKRENTNKKVMFNFKHSKVENVSNKGKDLENANWGSKQNIFKSENQEKLNIQNTPSCSTQNICDIDLKNEVEVINSNSNSTDFLVKVNTENDNDELVKICPNCNNKVPKSEYMAHMDYHMAVTLMEEEKKLFQEKCQAAKLERLNNSPVKNAKNLKSPVKNTKNSKLTKQVKRKLSHSDNNFSIASFLTLKPNQDQSQMEKCSECGKLVETNDFISHLDFHAAKKLHLELNPVKFASSKNVVIKKKKVSKTANDLQSLCNFFKPL